MGVIVSRANKSLLVPDGYARYFPKGVRFQDSVIIPHDMVNTLLMRSLGHKVPNPMLEYYDWPGGTPFESQRVTCDLLTSSPRAYVLNDMGTGKTRAALWAWDYLYSQGMAGKLLVVCKLSNMHFTWAREAFATIPHRRVQVLHGTKPRRLDKLNDHEADIYIINHDGVKVIHRELEARDDIGVLCIDELATYRNDNSRSRYMRKFSQQFNLVWGMTGRPMPNEPTDVWSQCKIVTPSSVPKTRYQARNILMQKVSQWVWIPKEGAVEQAYSWMQPAVRFTLDEVTELPPVVERFIDIDPTPKQAAVYREVAQELQALVESKKITAANAGVAMGKLLQVAGGWVYTVSPDYVAIPNQPRVETLMDLIDSASHKVLVFVPYRHALEELGKHLEAAKVEFAIVHGDTKDRETIFNLFQNTAKYHVLLAHPACLAHGLTLTAADTIIWYLPTTSLEMYEQANARIRRHGQQHKQQILHMQAFPVERKIYRLLAAHQRLQNVLLSMFAEATAGREL